MHDVALRKVVNNSYYVSHIISHIKQNLNSGDLTSQVSRCSTLAQPLSFWGTVLGKSPIFSKISWRCTDCWFIFKGTFNKFL